MSRFQLDIITPTSIKSFSDVAYLRMPGLDGLIGVQSKHANSIIALDVGEIKITINGKDQYFATSGGFSDIKKESVQLLLETAEEASLLNSPRAEESLARGKKRLRDTTIDLNRAQQAIKRAANRIQVIQKFSHNK